jgi:hypothetical protein
MKFNINKGFYVSRVLRLSGFTEENESPPPQAGSQRRMRRPRAESVRMI